MKMANLSGRRNPRDPTPVDANTYYRVEKPAPEKSTLHVLVPQEAAANVPALQQAAEARLATIDYGPDGLPPQVEVKVTAWEPRRARPISLGPTAGVGLGAGAGGVIAVVVAGGEMLFDETDHPDWASQLATQGGTGVIAGGSQAAIERAVASGAGRFVPGASSNLLRTMGGRAGAGVVGAGLEAYGISQEEREHSPAEVTTRAGRTAVIGLVSYEAGVAATSAVAVIFASAGTGAAAGSIAPGVGTAIGFIVGLGVGFGTYYLLDKVVPGGRKDWEPSSH